MTERQVVRMASLRSTVFLMSTEDVRWVRTVGQPALDAELAIHAKQLNGAEPDEIVQAGRALLTGTELSVRNLGQLLGARWPEERPSTLSAIVRAALPLCQVPPRGRGVEVARPPTDFWRSGHLPLSPRSPAMRRCSS